MQYLYFSNFDKMPALGLGTYKTDPNQVYDAVISALKVGYRHLDCAYIYGNEAEIGKALQTAFKDGIVKREELWITSKLWCSEMQVEDVPTAINKTLHDLQLDYLDLYLIHWPVPLKKGVIYPQNPNDFISPDVLPIKETWQALESEKKAGKIKHLGVSNFSISKLDALLNTARIKPEVNQIEMHPFLAQNDMVEFCRKNNVQVTGYAPLGTGDRNTEDRTVKIPSLLNNSLIKLIAKDHYATTAQILIAWGLQRGTSVIPKSANPDRIKTNFEAQKIELKPEEMEQINELDFEYRYITGEDWTIPGSPHTLQNLWD